MKRIAVFASGAGTNAANIIAHFASPANPVQARVALIVCNNPHAGVLAIAKKNDIPVLLLEKERFFHGDAYVTALKEKEIHLIVLAGFLWKVPDRLIEAYPQGIINIHPALLPKFGGKGMYGHHVHQAVIASNEKETGITIHYVDGHYDNGDIIFRANCPVEPGDTPAGLAERVHRLEQEHYPRVIAKLLT